MVSQPEAVNSGPQKVSQEDRLATLEQFSKLFERGEGA